MLRKGSFALILLVFLALVLRRSPLSHRRKS